MDIHELVVNDYGGAPFADHDYACPVCQKRHAILNLNTGVFNPCGRCSEIGWRLRPKKWWERG